MFHVPPILVAGLTGLVSGFLLSVPVGPINLTIINEGARRGFNWASLIGLGAVVMDNPGVLVFWIILAANFISREWVEPNLMSKVFCISGVAVGTGVWFLGLS